MTMHKQDRSMFPPNRAICECGFQYPEQCLPCRLLASLRTRKLHPPIRAIAVVWWRGFSMVALTAANIWLVSRDRMLEAAVISTLISAIWWNNAHASAMKDIRWGWVWYGLGGGCGMLAGVELARWFA